MKSFIILSSILLIGFIVFFTIFGQLTQPLIDSIKKSRITLAQTNSLANSINQAKTDLDYFIPERRQKLTQALPTPFDVRDAIAKIGVSHGVTAEFTPGTTALNTSSTSQPQELNGTLKFSAPTSQALTGFLTELETTSLIVTIKKLTIAPIPTNSAIEGLCEIGVYVK